MGTDFPDLPGRVITDAMAALDASDSVIGPTCDGGYYLIGFRRETFLPDVFQGKRWGERDVFESTMDDFAAARLKVHQLPKWRDVDDDDDLKDLIRDLKQHPDQAPHTYRFLRDGGLKKFYRS
jgi:glycosyltransferase A (GT-A) superfamily protein (DUF2064 family)